MYRQLCQFCLLWVALTAIGCQKSPPPEFKFDRVEWLKTERTHLDDGDQFSADYQLEVPAIMEAMFGTPEHAWFPFQTTTSSGSPIVSSANLTMAAGAVASAEDGSPRGLYREHCTQCHGVTGDGAGPTAGLLYPYPRDFRLGKFKFKSTPQRHPPTDDDLRRTLKQGIPGTAMPSFKRLKEPEIDALIDYAKYLSIRGSFEKQLIFEVPEIDDEPFLTQQEQQSWLEPLPRAAKTVPLLAADPTVDRPVVDYADRTAVARQIAERLRSDIAQTFFQYVIDRWAASESNVTDVPAAPASIDPRHDQYDSLVMQGQQLFLGKGGCVQCHGADGRGVGEVENNYDDWANNWLKSPGVDPTEPTTFEDFKQAGALTPRIVSPRNLRLGVYRGGGDDQQLFRRIANGIEGTPMPAAVALNADQIWALVAFAKSLPNSTYEPEPKLEPEQKHDNASN